MVGNYHSCVTLTHRNQQKDKTMRIADANKNRRMKYTEADIIRGRVKMYEQRFVVPHYLVRNTVIEIDRAFGDATAKQVALANCLLHNEALVRQFAYRDRNNFAIRATKIGKWLRSQV